jgi:hypothetical protein
MQLLGRGLSLTPLVSFNAWKEKGRHVKRNEKAIKMFIHSLALNKSVN